MPGVPVGVVMGTVIVLFAIVAGVLLVQAIRGGVR
jgi:hypothetical protein